MSCLSFPDRLDQLSKPAKTQKVKNKWSKAGRKGAPADDRPVERKLGMIGNPPDLSQLTVQLSSRDLLNSVRDSQTTNDTGLPERRERKSPAAGVKRINKLPPLGGQ